VHLYNRRGLDITYRYPELEQALAGSCTGCILDGEITVFAEGKPSFHSLAQRDHQSEKLRIDYLSQALPASYVVFDMLYAGGSSLLDLPLQERKQLLPQQLQESENVSIIDFYPARGKDYFSAALKMGIEGAMAKRQASPYQPGKRSQDWIKIKKSLKLDLVVGGYIPGKGERSPYFGGLLLGAYERGLLYFVGRVGSGFTEAELAEITGSLVQRDSPPFTNPPATPEVRWTEPLMVVQVSALEVTEDGHLRAPVFLRRREDKVPEECELSQLG